MSTQDHIISLKKNDNSKSNHNKYIPDNIVKKIKKRISDFLIEFTNNLINSIYDINEINKILLNLNLHKFELKNQKKIMMILKRIKDHYQKAIVIVSNDTETLYRETEHCIIMKNDKVLIEDKTIDVFKQIDFLKKHKVEIPEIIEFTFLANKKAKIDYYRDVRDLIKDIYKHV